jgi:hypothetical protein
MEFAITKIEEGLVRGLVRANGRDLGKAAMDYMATPNQSCPYAGGSGGLCPVESWVAKSNGEVPGGGPGDWGLVFSARPSTIAALRSGESTIVAKEENGKVSFAITKSIEVNKMATANEIFDQLVEDRMAELRMTRSDLTEAELREKAKEEVLREHGELSEVTKFHQLVNERINAIRKSAASPQSTKILKALATSEITKERPDLARAVMRMQNIEALHPAPRPVAKAAPSQPMGPAAREMDRLVESRMNTIRKSAGARDESIIKSMAVAAITRENPELTRAVISEERQAAARLAYGGMV